MNRISTLCLVAAWLSVNFVTGYGNSATRASEATLALPSPGIFIDADKAGQPISKYIYGQFIEHLGRCIYGGIWAEMLEDRKFYFAVGANESPWKGVGDGAVIMVREGVFVGEHTPKILATGNGSDCGIAQTGLGLISGKSYVGRIWLAGDKNVGPVKVSLIWGDGPKDRDTVKIDKVGPEFSETFLRFRAGMTTDNGRIEIIAAGVGNFRIGTLSLMPSDNIKGMRRDTLALLKDLDSPVYRWPGGNFVSGYNWKDGIGDRDRRPPRKNPAWKGVEHNDFGMDEFMVFCKEIGTEAFIAVNSGLGDVKAAAEEVEYANGSRGTPMGKLRAANGQRAPYAVKFWSIGNEMYGKWQLGNMPLDEYVQKHNEFAKAMRAVDPSIKLIGVGSVGRWSETMMRQCADHMEYISEHFYNKDKPDLDAHVRQIPNNVKRIADAHRKYRAQFEELKGHDIRIALDEWNYWYGPHVFGELGTRYFLKDGLGIAAGLNEYARNSDIIYMANYAQTVNVIGAIKTSKTAAAFETTGLALKLYRKQFGTIPVATDSPREIDAQAAWSDDHKTLTIAIVNPSMKDLEIPLTIKGAKLTGKGTKWEIAGNDPMAYNDPADAEKFKIIESSLEGIDKKLVVAPCSVTLFALSARPAVTADVKIPVAPAAAEAAPTAAPTAASVPSLTVQVDRPGVKVSPMLYGIFFEEINRAGEGGIWADMISDPSFEEGKLSTWSLVKSGSAEGAIAIDAAQPMSEKNPHSLRLDIVKADGGRVGVANEGYKGISLKRGAGYNLSFFARVSDEFKGSLNVTLESGGGVVLASGKIDGVGAAWKKYECSLTASATDLDARLVIAASSPGAVWLDVVSLFPKETWKNHGFRPDLMEKLAALKPAFVRFPGGCWVEGDTMPYAYRWKTTIGEPGDRRSVRNLWNYTCTNALGYHEYLQLCEDLASEPLFVINIGMSHKEVVPMEKMDEFVQDALDAIEYANGGIDTKWGAVRVKAGHPAPFNLKYLEIGNENGGKNYDERYALMYDAVKKRYPSMICIADTAGPAKLEIVDEHYYNSPEFFINNAGKYDRYNRGGPRIYVGEYAVTQGSGQGNLRAAVGEAAFMTGMERNSDVVTMSSYAPLFANVHYKKWNPDAINFDNSRCYGTPSYWVQQMFAANRPDVIVPVDVKAEPVVGEAMKGAVGVGTWATQAEFKDIKVTQGEKVLFQSDFGVDTKGWKTLRGQWKVQDGSLVQSANETDVRATAGDRTWTDYTYSLKAKKTGGAEGFLVMFHVQGDRSFAWWNIGGWGNSRHGIEVSPQGGKSELGESVAGRIETGRWYDIRIEVKGESIKCYLDGKLIHDVVYTLRTMPLYATAGRMNAGGEVVLKVVNVSDKPLDAQVIIRGAKIGSKAALTRLASTSPMDENSLDEPAKVKPVASDLNNASDNFRHTFPGNSVSVLRLKAE